MQQEPDSGELCAGVWCRRCGRRAEGRSGRDLLGELEATVSEAQDADIKLLESTHDVLRNGWIDGFKEWVDGWAEGWVDG
jgi:hypothetical protein